MKSEVQFSNGDYYQPKEPEADWMLTRTGKIILLILLPCAFIVSYFRHAPEKLEGYRSAQVWDVFTQDGRVALKVKYSKSLVDRYFETPSILTTANSAEQKVLASAEAGDTITFRAEPTADTTQFKVSELKLIKKGQH